jgi:D-3-phosphoglycerate dehydrogenase / 2-oxoglutarate reductase
MTLRAVALNFSGSEPWDLEAKAAAEAGGAFDVLEYEDFCSRPVDCELLINAGGWPVPATLLDEVPSCRMILVFGVGLDWVDRDDAAARGILLANTPLANVEDVATHAMALLLACVRRVVEFDARVRDCRFDRDGIGPMRRLAGRRLGLLSFGNIPRRLTELIRPFGMSVAAHDPYVPDDVMLVHGVRPLDLESLLRWSEVLSVHTPATSETRGLLDEERLRLLPSGAIVVVTSRGSVYDAAALSRLLSEGHIASAGLDVFPEEPLPVDDSLLSIPTVVLTPHVGGRSEEAAAAYHAAAAEAVTALSQGRLPQGAVDPGGRVLHIGL